jgi:hypothetical protein
MPESCWLGGVPLRRFQAAMGKYLNPVTFNLSQFMTRGRHFCIAFLGRKCRREISDKMPSEEGQLTSKTNMKINFSLIVFAVAGRLLLVAPSAPCQTWQATTAPDGSWTGVACSSDASRLVAVSYYLPIYISTDSGATWTPRESARNWQAVASSADGVSLVAVVYGGQIYTSTNSGADWTPRESVRNWQAVASSADGTRLVAVVANGQIYTSGDSGVTWLPRENNRLWTAVTSSSDGSRPVAIDGGGLIYTSTDFGTNWTPRGISSAWLSVASSADGSHLVVAAFNPIGNTGGQLYISTNGGGVWTTHLPNTNWWTVASSADGTKLIAGVRAGLIYISTNSGTDWTPSASTDHWSSVACSADGNKCIAAAENGKIYVSPPLAQAPPSLALFSTATNTVVITWPSSLSGWNLQQSTNLTDASWDMPLEPIGDDGTNKFIIINAPAGNRFYRLLKP